MTKRQIGTSDIFIVEMDIADSRIDRTYVRHFQVVSRIDRKVLSFIISEPLRDHTDTAKYAEFLGKDHRSTWFWTRLAIFHFDGRREVRVSQLDHSNFSRSDLEQDLLGDPVDEVGSWYVHWNDESQPSGELESD